MKAGRIVSVTFGHIETPRYYEEEEPEPMPPPAKISSDRLELYMLARQQFRHLAELFRDVENGRAELESSLPILARASKRVADALHELSDPEATR